MLAVHNLEVVYEDVMLAVRGASLSVGPDRIVALLTRSSTFDTGAARRDFGYSPVVDRDTGLAEFKTWVDAQGGVPELTRHLK